MLKLILGFKLVSVWDHQPDKSMSATVNVLLICCLLQGISCQNWAVFMPRNVRGLDGSCVMIPCRFTLPSQLDSLLDDSCKAIWKSPGRQVFDSSLTGEETNSNIVQGHLRGNLREKDCTTIFYNLPFSHDEYYEFTLHCNNPNTRFNFQTPVLIQMRESLPGPSITPSSLEVESGSPLRLTCSAVAPCPILLPALTWTPSLGDTEDEVGDAAVTSVMNFTASYRHHQQKISCAALYKRQGGNSDLLYGSNLTISILYPPKDTSVSDPGPVREGSWMVLTCSADANPSVSSYTWYKVDGDQVTAVGSKYWLVTNASDEQFYCMTSNRIGNQSSPVTQIDLLFPPKETSVIVEPASPVLEGTSVTLTCSSRANPKVMNYTWFRDDQDTRESGSTLVLTLADPSHTGGYRCKATNQLGGQTSPTVLLDVQYPPKNTWVLVDPSGSLLAGTSVNLTCRTAANPAAENFTWYRADGEKEEMVGLEGNFTFMVTKLSKDKYRCEAANVHGGGNSGPVSINVTFAAEVLPSSGCVRLSSEIRCTCDSHGNPPPSLDWQVAGGLGNSFSDLLTTEEPLGSVGTRSVITFSQVDEEALSIVCLSINSLGSDRLMLNVSVSYFETELHTMSIVIGSALGALVLLLVLQLFIHRKRRCCHAPDKGLVDSSHALEADGPGSLQVDVI
ncbi:B-cell receptor CD22-like [Genypterus blacodes]|uniref:B-cell receptor CD22-like n=1 Tax=Genypterus blacodes TaxID=154954 RepID=UPI003F75B647